MVGISALVSISMLVPQIMLSMLKSDHGMISAAFIEIWHQHGYKPYLSIFHIYVQKSTKKLLEFGAQVL